MNIRILAILGLLIVGGLLVACGGGGGGGGNGENTPPPPPPPPVSTLDDQLRQVIAAKGLTGDPTTGRDLPSINEPLAQLGKLLLGLRKPDFRPSQHVSRLTSYWRPKTRRHNGLLGPTYNPMINSC